MEATMPAVVFEQQLMFKEMPVPVPPPGEVLIRPLLAGICNTDIELINGYMSFSGVLGHEFVGVVHACHADLPNEMKERWLGQRVVGEINCGCGHCELCAQHDPRHCQQRNTLGIDRRNGVFAPFFSLPVENLLAVPDNVSNEQAVLTEPLAAAMEILEQVHIKPYYRVAVFGDGKLGQLCARVLATTSCDLVVIGKHPDKLKHLEQLGINVCLLPDWQADASYDVVVEATGSPSGFSASLGSVRSRGTLVLKSTFASSVTLDLAPIVVREITIVGSRCGRFAPALRALERGLIKTAGIITAHFPLSQAKEAFELAQSKGALKVVFDISD